MTKDNNGLLLKMQTIHRKDADYETMNSAMIDCNIELVDYGKLVNFKRFSCFSYTDFCGNGLSIVYLDKQTNVFFHATVSRNYIMIYPANNKTHQPQIFVDFFEHIKAKLDKNAELMTYNEYQDKYRSEENTD